ncbi:hypothetical protein [Burkholderia cenocepacia]|uniref:hypothetical protein n=1 Tax=Burkholderia cenocepacia TaxID=95486 RepID=UPI002AB6E1AD|nr:hypothetical protein [Burkholderia cenocepacia]
MDLMKKLVPALSIDVLATGALYRAFVVLPAALCRAGRTYDERTVLFEVPAGIDEAVHLERLLEVAWSADTRGWTDGCSIYNIISAAELLASKPGPSSELRLLDVGGGVDGVGPAKAYYARAVDVDLFVTPPVAERLHELLSIVEHLYEAQRNSSDS